MSNLLSVKNLNLSFKKGKKSSQALRNLNFDINLNETLCVVGESGCGKSITSLSIIRLLQDNVEINEGEIYLEEKNLLKLSERQMENVRGNDISMIFQEPMTALNPTFTIGFQLNEPLIYHKKMSPKEATKRSIELLKMVGIPDSNKAINKYPHQLSGGMRQRVMIAMALACEPKLLLADEPTTALDVTTQAQILTILEELKERIGMGVLFVTHDMGVVAEIADTVMVMYSGEIVEIGTVDEVFNEPRHPYTKALLKSVPDISSDAELSVISGDMPNIDDDISGCRFHPRCPFAMEKCKISKPNQTSITSTHKTFCWLEEEANG